MLKHKTITTKLKTYKNSISVRIIKRNTQKKAFKKDMKLKVNNNIRYKFK